MQPVNRIVTDVSPDGNILANIHQSISELLEWINEYWDSLPKRPPVDSALALSDTPIYLQQHGRRRGLIFIPRPVTLSINIPGLGQFLVTPRIGWNNLSVPMGTQIALTSGELSAVYRCTDS
jgi:hypothetical protein